MFAPRITAGTRRWNVVVPSHHSADYLAPGGTLIASYVSPLLEPFAGALMSLSVPEHDRKVIIEWLQLDDATAGRLIDAIERAGPALQPDSIMPGVAAASGMDEGTVRRYVRVFLNMLHTASRQSLTADQLAADIRESVGAEDPARVHARVTSLFSCRALRTTSKAAAIQTDNEHSYVDARVVTDLRIVFDDSTLTPAGSMAIHHLRITHRSANAGALTDFVVALDKSDVESLRAMLTRALLKDDAVRALATRAEIPNLER